MLMKRPFRFDVEVCVPTWHERSCELVSAARAKKAERAKILLDDLDEKNRARPDFNNSQALLCAEDPTIVKMLLDDNREHRALPDSDGSAVLRHACSLGKTEIVKLLLEDNREHRAKPDDHNSFSLRAAAERGYTDVVQLLLDDNRGHRAKPNEGDSYALRQAVRGGHVDVVRLLVQDRRKHRVSISCIDGSSYFGGFRSCLQDACDSGHQGHVEIVKLLMRAGASIFSSGIQGCARMRSWEQFPFFEERLWLLMTFGKMNMLWRGFGKSLPLHVINATLLSLLSLLSDEEGESPWPTNRRENVCFDEAQLVRLSEMSRKPLSEMSRKPLILRRRTFNHRSNTSCKFVETLCRSLFLPRSP